MCAFFFLAFLLAFLTGCSRNAEPPHQKPTVAAGPGIIRGTVCFLGKTPEMQPIGGNCCPGATPAVDESILVSPDGKLKNAVVSIEDGPNVDLGLLADRVLAQRDCRYVPHVLAVHTGQSVVVSSHDATLHNVHIEAEANRSQNFSESQGDSHAVNFAAPEVVKFKCDVHPWMMAYVHVFDHPFFAVTDGDGKFEIDHLPPGTYTLRVWQEMLGTQQMQVTVTADKPAEVKFEYRGE